MQVADSELLDMECSDVNVAQDVEQLPRTGTMEINTDSDTAQEAAMITSWQYSATMQLIETVRERMEELSSPCGKKMAVWREVARDLAANGFRFSANQCDKKWRALKSRFKTVARNKVRNGSGGKKWEFYDAMEEVLAEDPSVRPPIIISSCGGAKAHNVPVMGEWEHDEPTPPNPASTHQTPPHAPTLDTEPEQAGPSLSDLEASQDLRQAENVRRCGKRKRDAARLDSDPPEWFAEFADKQLELLNGLKESVDRRNSLLEKLVDSVHHLTKRTRVTPKASRRVQTLLKSKSLYSSKDVEDAVAAVRACQLSFGQASKKFCIPKSTLVDRVSGRVKEEKCGRRQDIPPEVERAFVEKVLTTARSGSPLSKQTVLEKIGQLAKKMNLKTRFKNDMPSDMFWRGLKKRHPELAGHVAEVAPVSHTRPRQEVLGDCSTRLEDLVSELGLSEHPEAVWTCDETAVQFLQECAVARKGHGSASSLDSPYGEDISVMACVSAAGDTMPPMITVKGRTPENIHNFATTEGPPDSLWVYQESGCVTDDIFAVWFSQMFLKHCGSRRPQLLLLDSGDLEEKLDVVQLARDNNIRVLALPLHTGHVLHPLGRSEFGPLKEHYSTERTRFLATNPHSSVTEATWPGIFAKAWQRTVQESVIRQAFRSTGVFPCDRNVLQRHASRRSKGLKGKQTAPKTTTTTATHTITIPPPAVTTTTAVTAVMPVTCTATTTAPAVTAAMTMSPVVATAQTTQPSVFQDTVATPVVSPSHVTAAAGSSPVSDGDADTVSDDELVAEPSMMLENLASSPFLETDAAGLALPEFEEGLDMQTTTEVTVSTVPGNRGMKSRASRRTPALVESKKQYTPEDVEKAVAAVRACQLSFGQASKKFCIPKSTLVGRVSGRVKEEKCGRRQDIPPEVERAFVEKVLTAARSGSPLSKQTVLEKIGQLAKKMNLKTRFKNDMPSDMFWRGLKKRHPELAGHVA